MGERSENVLLSDLLRGSGVVTPERLDQLLVLSG
jgi:hypothetical protein